MSLILRNRIFPSGIRIKNIPDLPPSIDDFWFYSLPSYTQKVNTSMNIGTFFITPDGTKLFVCGSADYDKKIYMYTLSTPYDLSTATYVKFSNLNIYWSGEGRNLMSIYFNSVGNKLYVLGLTGGTLYVYIYQFDLSTPYDIPASGTLDVTSRLYVSDARGIYIDPTDTFLFTIGYDGYIRKYNLSSLIGNSSQIQTLTIDITYNAVSSIYFKNDGKTMYISTKFDLFSFFLNTAWDLHSIVPAGLNNTRTINISEFGNKLNNNYFSIASKTNIMLSQDGSKLFYNCYGVNNIQSYNLKSNWSISDIRYTGRSENLDNNTNVWIKSFYYKNDGTRLYGLASLSGGERLYQYNLSIPWYSNTINSTNYINLPFGDILGNDDSTQSQITFNSTGDTIYIVNGTNNNIYRVVLNTPWNINGGIASHDIVPVSNITQARGIHFKPDGTRVYILDNLRRVLEYNLSSPWNLSTLSYTGNLYTIGKPSTSTLHSLLFRNNGKEFYVYDADSGPFGGKICSYKLSTAWNLSTATENNKYYTPYDYGNSGNITIYVYKRNSLSKTSFFIPEQGNRLYIIDQGGDMIYDFDILS